MCLWNGEFQETSSLHEVQYTKTMCLSPARVPKILLHGKFLFVYQVYVSRHLCSLPPVVLVCLPNFSGEKGRLCLCTTCQPDQVPCD